MEKENDLWLSIFIGFVMVVVCIAIADALTGYKAHEWIADLYLAIKY